jgi:prepilin peptidase CpaA
LDWKVERIDLMALYFYPFIVFLLTALFFDGRYGRIPNWLTVSGAVLGLLFHVVLNGINGLIFSVIGLVAGFVLMLILYLFKAIGAGDVKLFGAIGAFSGIEFTLYGIMYSVIYAGLIGLVLLILRRDFIRRMMGVFYKILELKSSSTKEEVLEDYKKKEALTFPFMYAVIPGMITTYYYVIL